MGSGWQLSNSGWSAVGGRAQRCRLPWRWRGAGRSMSPRASSFNKSVRMAMSLSRPASLRHCHSWAKCWESRCRDHCGRSIRSARMPSMSASVKCRPWTQIVLTQPIYPETPHRVQRQMSNLQRRSVTAKLGPALGLGSALPPLRAGALLTSGFVVPQSQSEGYAPPV